jgi:exodeoxyribonuclease-3
MPTVSTANVNGVRAATGKGLLDWIAASDAEVICLQEVRARPEEVPAALTALLAERGLHLTLAPSETAKGRNGVAVLSRSEPSAVRVGFGDPESDDEGRYLEVDLPDLTAASLYLPKGVTGTAKQERKDRFLERFAPYLDDAWQRAHDAGREVVVCGDWNLAPAEADVRNWRNNRTNSGFLPHEREWWAALVERGWVDAVRAVHPDAEGPYSWWTYRGRAFDNDVGWRIDHQLATPGLAARAKDAVVDRAPSHAERWSDHAPVTVRYAPA